MLSSVAKLFTPGGRRRSGEQDVDVQEDVAQDVAQDFVDVKLAPTVLFDKELDEKHVDIDRDFDAKYSDVSGSSSSLTRRRQREMAQLRKGLPKIEYSKLVMLSLTNFSQYRESIKVLGYSRQWPKKYAEPTLEELKQVWSGVDGNSEEDECRREAYLVLYQTIPLSLKYLVRNVKNGDVIALWRVLYNRFLHVTDASLKNMKKEWETLSMSKMKVSLDEFISVVATKANDLRMVGEKVTEKAEAVALVCGLPEEFAWIKNFFGTKAHYSFEEVVEETMKFAADNGLFKSEGIVGPSLDKKKKEDDDTIENVCVWFNLPKGCNKGENCKFIHKKIAQEKIAKLQKKMGGRSQIRNNVVALSAEKDGRHCFKCGDKDHLANACPLKDKINDFIKGLKRDAVDIVFM